jgi:hypothetical protein
VCQWQAALFDLGAPGTATALNAGRRVGVPQRAFSRRCVAGPSPLPLIGWHVAAPVPFPRGRGGPVPPRPVVAVWPVMVRPSHVAAPDPLGSPSPRGQPESPPALLGAQRPRTPQSSGRVRRPWSQLSGPGNVPRHPEGEEGIMDYETPRAWTP